MNAVRTSWICFRNWPSQQRNRLCSSSASVIAVVGLVAAALGCEPSQPTLNPRPSHLEFALDLGAVEQTHQWLLFDERPTPLRTGNGWSESRYGGGVRGWGHHAWVSRRATLHFRADGSQDLELIARTRAYDDPRQDQQHVDVSLNDHPLGRRGIPRDWAEIRVHLPKNAIKVGLNTIDLRFAWDTNPHHLDPAAEDRFMAAVFTAVGIVPSEHPAQDGSALAAGFIPGTNQLVLGPGGSAWLAIAAPVDLAILPVRTDGGEFEVSVVPPHLPPLTERCAAPCSDGLSVFAGAGDEVVIRLSGQAAAPATVRLEGVHRPQAPRGRLSDRRTPDILLYVVDTLRADSSYFGGKQGNSPPQIEHLVETATVFENARSTAPWTLPATWSLLTGQYPTSHGFRKAASRPADLERLTTLGERLSPQGYRTVAASQSYIIGRTYGYDRGFADFTLCDRLGSTRPRSEDARWIAWHALRETPLATPVFLYVHTVEPHAPYSPTDASRILGSLPSDLQTKVRAPVSLLADRPSVTPGLVASSRELYNAEARQADLAFGDTLRLMKALNRLDHALVVFTSDHGEEFYEHGGFDHSRTLFEELLSVPLAVWFPDGESAGTHTKIPVSLLDVVPTVMAAAGVSPDPGLPGSDLRDLVAESHHTRRIIAAETDPEAQPNVWAEVALRCAVIDDLKCIVSDGSTDRFGKPVPAIRCFDLARDPAEKTPLEGPAIVDVENVYLGALAKIMPRAAESERKDAVTPIDEEARARLRALGYLGD